jgi:hypothetical protein
MSATTELVYEAWLLLYRDVEMHRCLGIKLVHEGKNHRAKQHVLHTKPVLQDYIKAGTSKTPAL